MRQVYVVANRQSEHVVAEGVRGSNPRVGSSHFAKVVRIPAAGFRRVDISQIFEYRCKLLLQTTERDEEC
jgi:hypothetical protein